MYVKDGVALYLLFLSPRSCDERSEERRSEATTLELIIEC